MFVERVYTPKGPANPNFYLEAGVGLLLSCGVKTLSNQRLSHIVEASHVGHDLSMNETFNHAGLQIQGQTFVIV